MGGVILKYLIGSQEMRVAARLAQYEHSTVGVTDKTEFIKTADDFLMCLLNSNKKDLITKIFSQINDFKQGRSGWFCRGKSDEQAEEQLLRLNETLDAAYRQLKAEPKPSFFDGIFLSNGDGAAVLDVNEAVDTELKDKINKAFSVVMKNISDWKKATIPKALQDLFDKYQDQIVVAPAAVAPVVAAPAEVAASIRFLQANTRVNSNKYGLPKNQVRDERKILPRTINDITYSWNKEFGFMGGDGHITYADGSTYVGGRQAGMKSGKGTLTLKPDEVYDGDWKNNELQTGVIIEPLNDNLKYVTRVTDGEREDPSYVMNKSVRNQASSMENDALLTADNTTVIYPIGDTYTGKWADGLMDGTGTYIVFTTGAIHDGDWKNNELQTGVIIRRLNEGLKYVAKVNNYLEEDSGLLMNQLVTNQASSEIKTNCLNEFASVTYPSGAVYLGEFKAGLENGNGTMIYPEVGSYTGEWENGLKSGKGHLHYENNDINDGDWEKDKLKDGVIIYTVNDGYKYVVTVNNYLEEDSGYLMNNSVTNQASSMENDALLTADNTLVVYPNGDTYTGKLADGSMNGTGIYIVCTTGEVQDGDWENNELRTGVIIRTLNDDLKYVTGVNNYLEEDSGCLMDKLVTNLDLSEIKTNCLNEFASVTYPSGAVYLGEFKAGLENGNGTMIYPDKTTYYGNFKDGFRSGQGKMTYPDGYIEDGEWENDEFVGEVVI